MVRQTSQEVRLHGELQPAHPFPANMCVVLNSSENSAFFIHTIFGFHVIPLVIQSGDSRNQWNGNRKVGNKNALIL